MPQSSRLQGPHRMAYAHMVKAIEAGGQYVVNNKYREQTENKKNIRAAQSYLWSQIPITSSQTQYVFNIKEGVFNTNTTGLLQGENRLKLQDVFFTYALGFYLVCYTTGGGATQYRYKLMTFPSANFFGSGGVNLDTMQLLWTQGRMNVAINGDVLTPGWDMSQHYYVPQTQIPAVGGVGTPYFDETDQSDDGYVVVEPNWILNGANDNVFTVNYGTAFSGLTLGTGTWHLVMKWQGFLAQNASSIMNNQPAMGPVKV